MKFLIATDKFKGSLTSFEAGEAIAAGIREAGVAAETEVFPMADGGDGFAAVMGYYRKTETIRGSATDPLGRTIEASWQWSPAGRSAIIEMAVASGLALLRKEERNPLSASTYGTGTLIKNAWEHGAQKIILGLGGSATNDAGMGILAALGFRFTDSNHQELPPCGQSLPAVTQIIPPGELPAIRFEIACDVQNILYGPQGAAYIYAPQKGADEKMLALLDGGLRNFAALLQKHTGRDIANIPGTGAAGGIPAGLMAFFEVQLRSGTEMILDVSGIREKIQKADRLITGEGKIDAQTEKGKVVSVLANLAAAHNIPVTAICGKLKADADLLGRLHINNVISLSAPGVPEEEAMKNAAEIIRQKVSYVKW